MAPAVSKTWKRLMLAIFVVCLAAAGCKGNNSSEAAEKDTEKAAANGAKETGSKAGEDEGGEKDEGAAAEVADDLYPDFNFGLLNDKEQARFVKLAKAELCPCPDSNASLHQCLQSRDERCGVAMNGAQMMAMMIKGSYNDTDILDKVAEMIEAAKADHEFVLEGRPVKGNPKAKAVLVEFADFECPYCKLASKMLKDAEAKYGEDIAIYFKQFPLGAHQNAQLAAQASIAAHNQGKFWQMHDALFKNQKSLSEDKIMSLAQRIGLNMAKFKKDLNSNDTRNFVARDKMDGEESGMTGTPTLFFNGKRYLGELTEEALFAQIEKAIADAKKADTTKETN